ncbi:antitoxin Xre/MbcA/ParS toxin-binding domain-containing protein [Chitinophaga lutea]
MNEPSGKKGAKSPKELLSSFESIRDLQTVIFTEREKLVNAGISKDQLAALKEIFAFDYNTLSGLLSVTDRTLHLKKGEETFSHIISDRIMAIVELYSYGYTVFGERQLFHHWMKTPQAAFADRAPLEVIKTHPGLLQVREELSRMRRGIL